MAAAGELQPSDMVWLKGSPRWVEATSLGLFDPNRETRPYSTPSQEPPQSGTVAWHASELLEAGLQSTVGYQDKQDTTPPTAVPAPAPRASVPGYEILAELGRGGMGVVYKARHLALKRLVALKMILAGAHAGKDLIDRFRTEAEAVARFTHPNIVQIYEISDKDGLPFCSLELVEGGSLAARVARARLAANESAKLVETLARAMHYAHQRNVVHRDLKPGNILIDEEGNPKITDFGLAKQLDADSGQTQSGMVMGTPSFMAPEQAAGQVHLIGPAADVYALGGILYDLLTGRPPFKGANVVETLKLVTTQEPTPPTHIDPNIPADLETICLKCLQKEPAQRYASALALAQDLERYQAGEPILARPEGKLHKLWRKTRRYRIAAAVGLVLVAAVAAAVVLAVNLRGVKHGTTLQARIEAALDQQEWTPEKLEETEGLIAEFAVYDPVQSGVYKERLLGRYRESLETLLARPRMEPQDVALFNRHLAPLDVRDPKGKESLAARLKQRLASWESAVTLRAPFVSWQDVFDPKDLQAADGELKPSGGGAPAQRIAPRMMTVACQGNGTLEATFAENWRDSLDIGLVLQAQPGDAPDFKPGASSPGGSLATKGWTSSGQRGPLGVRGYAFRLQPNAPLAKSEGEGEAGPVSFARTGGMTAQIWRDNILLAEHRVPVPSGRLTLRAGRIGDQLQLQINKQPPIEFHDPAPMPANQGYFAVQQPPGVGLVSLDARRQSQPPNPSPLEKADVLFAEGNSEEALATYRQFLVNNPTGTMAQEARYKAGLCALQLNRVDDAVRLFEQTAGETGPRWPMLAASHLWIIHLDREHLDDAEAVFLAMSTRYPLGEIFDKLPVSFRQAIFEKYHVPTGVDFMLAQPEHVVRLERALTVAEYLDVPLYYQMLLRKDLARLLQIDNKDVRALEEMQRCVRECDELSATERLRSAEYVMFDYCWLLRQRGEATKARAELDRWLYKSPGVYAAPLDRFNATHYLLERVRIDAALEDWAAAEQDLVTCFTLIKDHPHMKNYHMWSSAHLMQGFLRQRRGDEPGARESWKQGTKQAWLETLDEAERARGLGKSPGRVGDLHHLINAALSDELTEADAQTFLQEILDAFSRDPVAKQVMGVIHVPPGALKNMWTSPRGRDYAQRIAFRSLPFRDNVRVPVLLLAHEMFREGAFPVSLNADQDAVLWSVLQLGLDDFTRNKLGKAQLLQLGLTWKGTTNFLGWAGVAPKLDPKLRGPLAYVMGHRFLVLEKPGEAEMFFQTAVKDGKDDALLKRLGEVELMQLKMKER
jgi:tetratricopeptide (TPR) repeat protein